MPIDIMDKLDDGEASFKDLSKVIGNASGETEKLLKIMEKLADAEAMVKKRVDDLGKSYATLKSKSKGGVASKSDIAQLKALNDKMLDNSKNLGILSKAMILATTKAKDLNGAASDMGDSLALVGGEAKESSIGVYDFDRAIYKASGTLSKGTKALSEMDWQNFQKHVGKSTAESSKLRIQVEKTNVKLKNQKTQLADLYQAFIESEAGEKKFTNAQKEQMIALADSVEGIEKKSKSMMSLIKQGATAVNSERELRKSIIGVARGLKEIDWVKAIESKVADSAAINEQMKEYDKAGEKIKILNQTYADQKSTLESLVVELNNYEDEINSNNKITNAARITLEGHITGTKEEIKTTIRSIETIHQDVEGRRDRRNEIEQEILSMKSLTQAEDDAAKRTGIFSKSLQEGKYEAESFMGGLGGTATGMTAVGVATVYAATKLKDIGGQLVDLQNKWASYGVAVSVAQGKLDVGGAKVSLSELRQELSLTADQTIALGQVLSKEMTAGVISVDGLVEAAGALEKAFGEDPTNRLMTYVDLLKEIPTLDTDLKVTASLDDQAATWFALAKQGKVAQVIELQMAGLAGAESPGAPAGASKAELETLKEIRKGAVAAEDIQRSMASLLPASLGYYTQSIGALIAVGGTLGTIFTSSIAQVSLLRRIARSNEASSANTRSIYGRGKTSAIRRRPSMGGGRKATSLLKTGAEGGATGVAEKAILSLGKFAGTAGTAMSSAASSALALAGPVAAVAAPLVLMGMYGEEAGKGMKDLGKSLKGTRLDTILTGLLSPLLLLGGSTTKASSLLDFFGSILADTGRGISEMAGAAWDWISLSEEAEKATKKEAAEYIKNAKVVARVRKEFAVMQRAALSLESHMKAMDASFNTGKKLFNDASIEAGKMGAQLAMTSNGSVVRFDSAVQEAFQGVTKNFKLIQGAMAKHRKAILRDATLTPELRKGALLELKKKELEATQTFVNGVSELTEMMLKSPDILISEMKGKIKSANIDIQLDAGAGDRDSIMAEIGQNMKLSVDELSSTLDNATKAIAAADKAEAEMREEYKSSAENVKTAMGSLVDDLKKMPSKYSTGEAAKALEKAMSGVMTEGGEKTAKSLESASNAITEQRQKLLDKLAKESGMDLTDMFDSSGIEAATNEATVMKKKASQMKTAADAAVAVYKEAMKETHWNPDAPELLMKLSDLQQAANKATDDLKNSQIDAKNAQKTLTAETEEAAAWAQNNYKALVMYAKENNLAIPPLKKLEKDTNLSAKWARKINSHMKNNSKEGKRALEQMKIVEEQIKIAASKSKAEALAWNTRVKANEAVIGSVKKTLSQINMLNSILERDPGLKFLERQQRNAELNVELQRRLGKSGEAEADLMEAQVQTAKRQIATAQVVKRDLEKVVQEGGSIGDGIIKVGERMEDSIKFANKELAKLPDSVEAGPAIEAAKAAGEAILAAQEEFKKKAMAAEGGTAEAQIAAREAGKEVSKAVQDYNAAMAEVQKISKAGGGEGIDASRFSAQMNTLNASIQSLATGDLQKGIQDADKLSIEGQIALTNTANVLHTALSEISSDPTIKLTESIIAQSKAQLENAIIMNDTKVAAAASAKGVKAIADQYNRYHELIQNKEKSIAILRKQRDDKDTDAATKATINAELQKALADKQAMETEAEINRRNQLHELIERNFDVQRKQLELKEEELSIAKDLAETTGANYGIIRKMQIEEISLAAQKAKVLRDELKQLFDPTTTQQSTMYEEKRLQLVQQEAEITKKAMGAQRDAFDKLLDKSFGAIRSARGARKGLLSTASIFGGTKGGVSMSGGMAIGKGAKSLGQVRSENTQAAGNAAKSAAEIQQMASKNFHGSVNVYERSTEGFSGSVDKFGRTIQDLGKTPGRPIGDAVSGAKLPKLASGGSVKETGAAVVHKGEVVIPKSNRSSSSLSLKSEKEVLALRLKAEKKNIEEIKKALGEARRSMEAKSDDYDNKLAKFASTKEGGSVGRIWDGAVKGAGVGAVTGGVASGLMSAGVGAVPGAAVGGVIGGVVGGIGGALGRSPEKEAQREAEGAKRGLTRQAKSTVALQEKLDESQKAYSENSKKLNEVTKAYAEQEVTAWGAAEAEKRKTKAWNKQVKEDNAANKHFLETMGKNIDYDNYTSKRNHAEMMKAHAKKMSGILGSSKELEERKENRVKQKKQFFELAGGRDETTMRFNVAQAEKLQTGQKNEKTGEMETTTIAAQAKELRGKTGRAYDDYMEMLGDSAKRVEDIMKQQNLLAKMDAVASSKEEKDTDKEIALRKSYEVRAKHGVYGNDSEVADASPRSDSPYDEVTGKKKSTTSRKPYASREVKRQYQSGQATRGSTPEPSGGSTAEASTAATTATTPPTKESAGGTEQPATGGGDITIKVEGTLTSNDNMFKAKILGVANEDMLRGQMSRTCDSRYPRRANS